MTLPMFASSLLGVDSLIAAAALGPWVARRGRLIASFAVCDGLATAVGTGLGWRLPPALSAAPIFLLLAYAGYLVLVSAAVRRCSRPLPYLVPVVCSLDNLFSGRASGGALTSVLGAFLASLMLAALGSFAAQWMSAERHIGLARARMAGVGLLAVLALTAI